MAGTPVVLFCVDPLTPRRTDPYFADQARTVQDLDGTVALIDHEALVSGDPAEAVRRVPEGIGPAWYRGWMIPADRYEMLADALAVRGVTMQVPPGHYRSAHELPGWYPAFEDVTPLSAWMPWEARQVPAEADVRELLAAVGPGPAIVKDYVKSRKYEWTEACFIPDAADTAHATAVIARMVALQDDSLAGGIVVRHFEQFGAPAASRSRAPEARVWWVDGRPVVVGPHPDSPDDAPVPDLTDIAPCVSALGRRFVTTDVVQRADGAWRVVEVGDGQVSDAPVRMDPAPLFAALAI